MVRKDNRFLAFLRGINVGGNNIIAKEELRECFENLGLQNVRTYIQSGNVLFRSGASNVKNLTTRIESALSKQFSYKAQAVVFSHDQYESDLQAAPKSWGVDETRKHNALFMLGDLSPSEVMAQLPPPIKKHETVGMGESTLFWSASKKHLGQTTIMKLAGMNVYKKLTVRNHNTTLKLLALLDEI